jgi:cytochrome oxidase assembly protein ShyY1
MIWIAAVLAGILIAIPFIIMLGFWQIEKFGIEDIDWRDDE